MHLNAVYASDSFTVFKGIKHLSSKSIILLFIKQYVLAGHVVDTFILASSVKVLSSCHEAQQTTILLVFSSPILRLPSVLQLP